MARRKKTNNAEQNSEPTKKGGKLYAGAKKIAKKAKAVVKAKLNKITANALATLNKRIDSWRDRGISDEQINAFLTEASKLDGVSVTSSGRLKIEDSKDEATIKYLKTLIPTWTELKKMNESVEKEINDIDEANEKEREQARAMAILELEAKRLRNRAADDLFGMWYEDKDKRLRSSGLSSLDEEDILDLVNELNGEGGLASRIAKGSASASEVYEFYGKVDDLIKQKMENKA